MFLALSKILAVTTTCFGTLMTILTYNFPILEMNKFIVTILTLGASAIVSLIYYITILISDRDKAKIQDNNVRIIRDSEELKNEIYQSAESVVAKAKQIIIVTGSRSRDEDYLRSIERKITQSASICYVRILVGPPHHQALRDHIERIRSAAAAVAGWPRDKIKIVETPYGGEWPERFICASESKAVIITQSPNSPWAFDTGIVIDDEKIVAGMVAQLRALADGIYRRPPVTGA